MVIHSLDRFLSSTYYVLSILLGAGSKMVKKVHSSSLCEAYSQVQWRIQVTKQAVTPLYEKPQ